MPSPAEIIEASPDLLALVGEGFEIDIRGPRLLVSSIAYLNSQRQVVRGTLVMPLDTPTGMRAGPPPNHTAHFIGDYPHYADKTKMAGMVHSTGDFDLGEGIRAQIHFSSRPVPADPDYYAKVVRYADLLGDQARVVDPAANARTRKRIETSPDDSPLVYLDTNSGRAQIGEFTEKLKRHRIAVVGVGGTGSYVVDSLAKTPVNEIHLFDSDLFEVHNAYRAPGAPTRDELQAHPKKVDYFASIYSRFHRGIRPHAERITAANIEMLREMTFVFLCVDPSDDKRAIVQFLMEAGIPFVDTGIGIIKASAGLLGIANLITVTPTYREHIGKIPMRAPQLDDLYDSNIQIAELNALNAAFAVIRWKKLLGFYHDEVHEHESAYTLNEQSITNDELGASVR